MQQAATTGGGEPEAYAAVNGIEIVVRVADGPVLFDQTFPYDPQATETRIPINVPVDGKTQATLEVTLFGPSDVIGNLPAGPAPLFTGTAALQLSPNQVSTADLVLVPVAAGISVPDTLPSLVSIGETQALRGTILFANGDTAASIHPSWISLTPRVVTVRSSETTDSVVAVALGTGQLLAFYGQYSDTVGIRVVQLPAAPSNFSAGFDGSTLYMNWQDNSASETSFVVERSTTSATSGFTQSSVWGAGVIYGSEDAPFPAQVLFYRVRACNDFGCSPPSNVVAVTAPNPSIQGTLYLCYSAGTSSCFGYGSQTVLLSGALTDSTVTNANTGTYYFYTGLAGGSTYTVSVRDVACQAAFRTSQFTVTPEWGETVTVDFYADTILCAPPGGASGSGGFDPVVANFLGIDGSNETRAGPVAR